MTQTEADLLSMIHELVDEERRLRESAGAREMSTDEEQARLRRVEEQLDQCWDLLRQRRARAEAGQDPQEAAPRPTEEVENYLQ
ncbi:DUF2630 family protein [Phytoactinopolyspora alkaliphila]|uniref:DUF2630 family protein n=1 Tax=Phytoactinopolyspora alkaliphila TaxID=1783498 RepID=A0A6N9YQP3_9ACTN|nr:DUF2630 family protein [Phytoactinopolyspora alkaliphila]NED97376.1 DUF2630 family protein [Phytoactinopolyspora alkaliphila]